MATASKLPRRPGRPPIPPEELRVCRVEVRLTAAELALLDGLRGDYGRSFFLALCLLMHRT
jgi:hypothetical protein